MVRLRTAVVAAALLLTGCDGGGAAVPEGFTRFDSDTFALSHPEDWEVGQQGGRDSLTALGEVSPQGIPEAAIVEIDPTFSGNFDVAIGGLQDLARVELPEFTVVSEEEVEVDGAQTARLLETTYLGTEEGGAEATVPMRQLDLLALNGEEILYYLRVNAPQELYDAETSRQIVDSFTLKG